MSSIPQAYFQKRRFGLCSNWQNLALIKKFAVTPRPTVLGKFFFLGFSIGFIFSELNILNLNSRAGKMLILRWNKAISWHFSERNVSRAILVLKRFFQKIFKKFGDILLLKICFRWNYRKLLIIFFITFRLYSWCLASRWRGDAGVAAFIATLTLRYVTVLPPLATLAAVVASLPPPLFRVRSPTRTPATILAPPFRLHRQLAVRCFLTPRPPELFRRVIIVSRLFYHRMWRAMAETRRRLRNRSSLPLLLQTEPRQRRWQVTVA